MTEIRMGNSRTKVLLTVIHLYLTTGRVVIRDVASGAGLSVSSTVRHLNRLRGAGLIDWEPNQHATIRPLVEVVG